MDEAKKRGKREKRGSIEKIMRIEVKDDWKIGKQGE